MGYMAKESRYDTIQYNRCGASGLKLPMVSLGFGTILGTPDIMTT